MYYDSPVRDTPTQQLLGVAVVMRAEERAKLDPTDYYNNKTIETIVASIDSKFGVSKSSLTSEKEEEGDMMKFEHVQVSSTHMFDKLEQIINRCAKYSMLNILTVHAIKNRDASLPISDILELDDTAKMKTLHEHWVDLTFEDIRFYQLLLNTSRYVREADQNGSTLLYKLLVNSCTYSLKESILKHFDQLPVEEQGGLTYLWLLLNHIFRQTPGVTESLVKALALFGDKGPNSFGTKFTFKVTLKYLKNALSLLKGSERLPSNALTLILKGGAKSKNELLADLSNKTLLNKEEYRLKPITFYSPPPSQQQLYDDCVNALDLFGQVYDDQVLSKPWEDVSTPQDGRINFAGGGSGGGGENSCFNCEKVGCNVKICKEKKDWARIKKNRDAFMEKKKERASSGDPKSKQIPERPSKVTVGNKVLTWCKPCGEYSPTHSTKFHSKWKKDKDGFNICQVCPTHPLVANISSTAASSADAETAASSGTPLDTSKVKTLLTKLEKQVSTTDAVMTVNALRSHFG